MTKPTFVVTDKILDLRIPAQAAEYKRWLNDPNPAPCNVNLALQLMTRLQQEAKAKKGRK